MKIHVFDTDPRKITEPEVYQTNMGSFGIVANLFNRGLKEIGVYAEPNEADYVGICDGLNFGFRYKDKKPFLVHVWDQINTIPLELRQAQKDTGMKMVGLSNQVSKLWGKYGVECKTAMPGCDTEFFKPTKGAPEQFTFLFDSFANVRSGLDLAVKAYNLAFGNNNRVQLVIKNTSNSHVLADKLSSYGSRIKYINQRTSFDHIKELYQLAHVTLHVYRHSSWGLGVHQSAACNAIPILGDFCPSNEMNVGFLLKPTREVEIDSLLPNLTNEWGLHNAYGRFNYDEPPRFYDYDIEEYADLLKKIYNNYSDFYSKVRLRQSVVRNFTLRKAAEDLVKALQ